MKRVAIVPAYNEEKNIEKVVDGLRNKVDEIIVVNDGSADRTGDILKNLDVITVSHIANKGYGEAMKSGFRKGLQVGGDFFLLIDADLQHNPAESSRLMNSLIDNNYDMVIGSRFLDNKSKIPFTRKLGIHIFTILTKIFLGIRITDTQSGFRAFSRKALEKIIDFKRDGMGSSIEILYIAKKNNFRIKEVPISCSYDNVQHSINPIAHGLQLTRTILSLYLRGI
ncbi:MAG: glycosyltransferase family 2 protein [Candidatus Aenigmarchaeota archaeon]|nr:glycosyltransferase family 2 protein [Candidatus Aenigmarchaeota archaeon]